ncbi:MAG: hypothetical protein M0R76_09685 [Proteobacteria bacterium]|nr:hypothetical protein [Pseudomonadota bacterium]
MTRNTARHILLTALLCIAIPLPLQADIFDIFDTDNDLFAYKWSELTLTGREDNAWKVRSKDIQKFNQRDCIDNVRLTFKVELLEDAVGSARNTYLVVGRNCDTNFQSCHVVRSQSSAHAGWVWKDVHLQQLFPQIDCHSGQTQDLWLAQLDSDLTYDESAGDLMARLMSIGLDVAGPAAAPQEITARIGDKNIELSWAAVKDADVAGFAAIYWSPEDGSMATPDTEAALLDSDDTGAQENDSEEEDTGSAEGEAGDTRARIITAADIEADLAIGDTEDTDTTNDASNTACPVPGGFQHGDAIDPAQLSGTSVALSPGASSLRHLRISGLTNGRAYNVAVVALDASGNPSRISEVHCAVPQATSGLGDAYEGALDGGYCFIATAAFASYHHPTVRTLRRFRDHFLAPMPGGATLIATYYAVGPTLAGVLLRQNDNTQQCARRALTLSAATADLLMDVGLLRVLLVAWLSLVAGLWFGFRIPTRIRRNR